MSTAHGGGSDATHVVGNTVGITRHCGGRNVPFCSLLSLSCSQGQNTVFRNLRLGPSPAAISSSGFQQEATTLLVLVSLATITVPD